MDRSVSLRLPPSRADGYANAEKRGGNLGLFCGRNKMFKDIKVGDIVLVATTVAGTTWSGKTFKLPFAVQKTTPTRFTVNGTIYTKKDGRMYGGEYYSGRVSVYDKSKDQSNEYDDYSNFKKSRNKAFQALEKLEYLVGNDIKSIDGMNKIIKLYEELAGVEVTK